MARLLIDLAQKGERVFAVVGSGHVIRQEWNLRDAFGYEPAWDQPALVANESRPFRSVNSWEFLDTTDGLSKIEVRSVHQDHKGTFWFSGNGVSSYDGDKWIHYAAGNEFPMAGASDMISINDETIVATGPGGIATLHEGIWELTSSLGAINPRVVFSANTDENSTVFFGANGGCAWKESGNWNTLTVEDGLPHPVVHACVRDTNGTIWAGTRRGLAEVTDGTVNIHYPEDNLGSILIDRRNRLWFGTRSSGVRLYDGTTWSQLNDGADIRPTIQSADGSIWAVSDEIGAVRFTDSTVVSYNRNSGDLATNVVFDIIQTDDEAIWLATDKGAARYRE
jgi:ligand-binding sensor domain-containing protein